LDLLGTVPLNWQINSHAGASDFTSDGHDDILWRDLSTGQATIWDIENATFANWTSLGAQSLNWAI